MGYQETIDYLFNHLPMFQRIGPAAYKKDLTNITHLCLYLQNPQNTFSTIHVGGTNGKGSVSNMIASVLQEAGYVTGLYTSPHMLDFRERIRINGMLCSEQFVIDFTQNMQPLIEKITPSFFEITVAMAFDYFAKSNVDIAVIEVGLGGRLDSTNIITPELSVITNIGLDHQQLLGDTHSQIALEKAGIIKTGKPVVIGEYHPETFPVFIEKAHSCQSALYLAEENVHVELLEKKDSGMQLHISYLEQLIYPNLICSLTGDYQLKNIATAIESIELLREMGYEIQDDAVYKGFQRIQLNTGFAGRFQKISDSPLAYCDCAHNAEGLHVLFQSIKSLPYNTLHIVTGAVNDKDIKKNLEQFPNDAIYYFSKPEIPRGMSVEKLEGLAINAGLHGQSYASVGDAYKNALQNAGVNDLVIICGSIFVVAEVLRYLHN